MDAVSNAVSSSSVCTTASAAGSDNDGGSAATEGGSLTRQDMRAPEGLHATGFWVCIDDVFLASRNRQRIQFVS